MTTLIILTAWLIPGAYLGIRAARERYKDQYGKWLEHSKNAGEYHYCRLGCVSRPSRFKSYLYLVWRMASWPGYIAIAVISKACNGIGALTFSDLEDKAEKELSDKELLEQLRFVEKFRPQIEKFAFDKHALTTEREKSIHDHEVAMLAITIGGYGTPLSKDYVRNMLEQYVFDTADLRMALSAL